MTLFIVLGVVLYVGNFVANFAINANFLKTAESPMHTFNTANATLNTQLASWDTTQKACADITCVTAGDAQAATYFTDFANTLHGTSMPAAPSARRTSSTPTRPRSPRT